jgi:hypothetical protein
MLWGDARKRNSSSLTNRGAGLDISTIDCNPTQAYWRSVRSQGDGSVLPSRLMSGPTSPRLRDPAAVPYFLWDTQQTVAEAQRILGGPINPSCSPLSRTWPESVWLAERDWQCCETAPSRWYLTGFLAPTGQISATVAEVPIWRYYAPVPSPAYRHQFRQDSRAHDATGRHFRSCDPVGRVIQ